MKKMEKEKIAVITGACGGIGQKLVNALKAKNIKCECIDKIKCLGNDYFICDLRDQKQIERTISKLRVKFDHIDYLFNVAGIGVYENIENLSTQDWNDSIAINLTAPYIFTKNLLPLLENSKNGLVVNFGSGMGIVPTKGRSAYCASKFGLRGFSLSLADEFQSKKVSFVLLTLGSIMTNFGTGGIEVRKRLEKEGKKYLSIEEVVSKVLEIIQSPVKLPEYLFYPPGYLSE